MGVFGPLQGLFVDLRRVGGGCRCGVGSGCVLIIGVEREGGLVAAAPVVLEFAVAPLLLESGLAGVFGGCVVEIPRVVGVDGVGRRLLAVVFQRAAIGRLLRQVFFALSVFGLFLLLLFQSVDNLLYHRLLLIHRQLRQAQQRVLQGHVLRIHGQFVEHVAAALQHLVVGVLLAELRNGLGIARLGKVVFALGEVDASQRDLAYGLVDAVACALLGRSHIVGHGVGRVAAR